jgi:GNAT superfamily N-acetyltransferase
MTGTRTNAGGVTLRRYAELVSTPDISAGLDSVLFGASNVKTFASDDARAEFRERWLGRYLTHEPGLAWLALSPSGGVAGYVVGSHDDPALNVRFGDIPYFATFKDLTRRFPAHLHVNLQPEARGSGLGSMLVRHFCLDAAQADVAGVHVVTGRGARNVAFYNRNGFHEHGCTGEAGREVVFLGRTLHLP